MTAATKSSSLGQSGILGCATEKPRDRLSGMAQSRCSNDAIRDLPPSLGSVFPVFTSFSGRFSFYEAKVAPEASVLPAKKPEERAFPFPQSSKCGIAGLWHSTNLVPTPLNGVDQESGKGGS